MPDVTREQVYAYADAHPKETAAQISRALGGANARTVQAWLKERVEPRPKIGGHKPKGTAPVATMAPDDRAALLARVRKLQEIITTIAERQEQALRDDPTICTLDPKTAQAVASYQRAISDAIEAHPGLLELARDGSSEVTEADERTSRVAEALLGKRGKT